MNEGQAGCQVISPGDLRLESFVSQINMIIEVLEI